MNFLESISENHFLADTFNPEPAEDASADDWALLLERSAGKSAWEFLLNLFVELRFPVQEGMSKDSHYNAAKRSGELSGLFDPGQPVSPDKMRVYLHRTSAGRIPVIEVEEAADFVMLLRCIAYRNEPREVPESMGAAMLDGYYNWARVHLYRERFSQQSPEADWNRQFERLRETPALYKDTLLLLSGKPYSNVPAGSLGLDASDWKRKSILIRREHESAHYMTKKHYGVAKNHIHDELIADYMGITAALGDYVPEYALTFLGLEQKAYRRGGRLENYLNGGEPAGAEFETFCGAIRNAIQWIRRCHKANSGNRTKTFHMLCRVSVAEMAAGYAGEFRPSVLDADPLTGAI